MKIKSFFVPVLCSLAMLHAQSEQDGETPTMTKVKLLFTYGITVVNPEQINERIANSNYLLNSETKSIKSIPEFAGTLTFRPQNDFKVLVLRAGFASVERVFSLSLPQTTVGTTPVGTITGEVTESYSYTPFSFGIGASDARADNQFQLELIYALSTITENGSYQTSAGERFTYSRELTSPAYGIRAAGHTTVRLSPMVGLTLELGYRYLMFDEYEDAKAARYSFLELPVSGITASAGLSVIL